MNFVVRLLCAAGTILLAYLLWPVLKWLAVAVFVLGFVLVLYLAIASRKVKKEIEKDPDKYFQQQTMEELKKRENEKNGDVIEAEYVEHDVTEKEKEEEEEPK